MRIEFELISQEYFSCMCICICCKMNYCEKREVCVSNSKSMVLTIFSRMCMCIEFVSEVIKQKNAHVSFLVGMVIKGVDCAKPLFYSVFRGLPP